MKSTAKQVKQSALNVSAFIKAIAVFLTLSLAICLFGGCTRTQIVFEGNTKQNVAYNSENDGKMLSVGYSSDDSVNPFFSETDLNKALASLVFEPLFYIDDTFKAAPALAESFSLSGSTLTVTLASDAMFSDGTAVTGADVVYSFNKAKSSPLYKSELLSIASATASGKTVSFVSDGNLINPEDSLVFPVVKASTAENGQSVPTGTGTYCFSLNQTEKNLTVNTYSRKPTPNIKSVKLVPVDSSSTLIHTLELGTIDTFFDDLSSGSYSQANAAATKVNLTNLVFLGLNCKSYGLSNASVRQAVYYSVNRQSVALNAFKGFAEESNTPYHPQWHITEKEGFDTSALSLDYAKAQELMTSAGFSGTINLTLIVYSGNSFKAASAEEIAKSLSNIGINVTIKPCTWEEYKYALQGGNYDMYIGEIKLPANMDMSALFKKNGSVYGISMSDTTSFAYSEFLSGNISLEAFTASFLQNLPFVPICFRTGVLFCSNDITPSADSGIIDAYKNVYEWRFISS